MKKLNMLIDIYEEEVVGVHSVGEKITDKEEARIISKKFGFIKWLVENEKIDFRKLDCKRYDVDIPARYYLGTYIRYSIEKEMLMALAIQDEPIKFLCNILR